MDRCVVVVLLVAAILSVSFQCSHQLESSQSRSLLRMKLLLNFPPILEPWKSNTDFCGSEPTPNLAVVCYDESVTQLHIIGLGRKQNSSFSLPRNFSIDSFFGAVAKLPGLKVLTFVSLGLWGPLPGKRLSRLSSLEILNLTSNSLSGPIPREIASISSLRTLVLDRNEFTGSVPSSLPIFLTVLSLKKNSLEGVLPSSLGRLESLRVLALSENRLSGDVPDLTRLANLQILELDGNSLGPKFPSLPKKLVVLGLRNNSFRSGVLSSEVESWLHLRRFDLSLNSFVGPFPQTLLSLPSVSYVNVAGNKFTGMLLENQPCNPGLEFVDLSSNLFTGIVPRSLLSGSDKVVRYSNNCLSTQPTQSQRALQFCHTEALAVGIISSSDKKPMKQSRVLRAAVASGVVGCVLGSAAIAGFVFFVYKKLKSAAAVNKSTTENASTGTGYTSSKLLGDARYMMKNGALGLPGYRIFSLDELEEATNNFDTSAFMGEGSHGQMYRGILKDGTCVGIRCIKMKQRFGTHNFTSHIETISKLRHRNLVSALGHAFECYLEDSSVSRVFLVFEYVPNGTLRSWISERHSKRSLTWIQRISAAIGVAKGIQFLHRGIVPGVYRNGITITDVLLDHSFTAKISSYNLPLLGSKSGKAGHGSESRDIALRVYDEEKIDVYDFGVILLELIKGRPMKSEKQVDALTDQIQAALGADWVGRRGVVDPTVSRCCLDQSAKTVMEICLRCLHRNAEERPSMEDVLWNLQYAAQVQEAWHCGESQSSHGSSTSSP